MKNHVLYFTKAERLGIASLLLLCLMLWVIPSWIPEKEEKPSTDFSDFQKSASILQNESQKNTEEQAEYHLQRFNPNTVGKKTLLAMGLSDRTIRSWQSYLTKGGRFKTWEDLKRFRALTETDRERIRPYVVFESSGKRQPTQQEQAINIVLPPLQTFDPNDQNKESLLQMGLSERVASNWDRFLKAGGRFRTAEAINKVYGLTTVDYQRLLPYVQIVDLREEWAQRETTPEVTLPSSYDEGPNQLVIDINAATAEEWQQLRGIGPAYSRRIVKFRNKLGGFHSVAQIKETYGLPDSVFRSIQLQLRPSPLLQYVSINQLDIKQLAAHPYLSYNDARAIVHFREEHGPFESANVLEGLYSLEKSTLEKMQPYWDFAEE